MKMKTKLLYWGWKEDQVEFEDEDEEDEHCKANMKAENMEMPRKSFGSDTMKTIMICRLLLDYSKDWCESRQQEAINGMLWSLQGNDKISVYSSEEDEMDLKGLKDLKDMRNLKVIKARMVSKAWKLKG